ncbi:lysosomal Pro-X carboxypeptidase precursor [Xenopus tropicalis]|uniref:Lysosomal Pro-X carboxypeptidase n=1 Tax=Xenopus tropicalis TaxID=8364 RepID=Q08D72_XENTR|eukprot:NP_001072639.1 lysosomal Pro-X carboxypeptidase precursor [Xenopus tropicalis]
MVSLGVGRVMASLPGCAFLAWNLLLLSAAHSVRLSRQFGSAQQYGSSNPGPSYETYYFTQQVDHFGFYEDATFKQRYLVSDTYWRKPGGPILFYTGNEGDITLFCNNTGFMWDVAEEMGAMLVFAEHRYYGESMPFGDLAFSDPKHLNYLTSEQALADFAVLLRYFKATTEGAQNSPVIALGGSYGGMLAAWFRMKYPDVVVGAIASSAPIWQFEDLVPCNEYYQVVTNDFKKSGPGCSESVRNSWAAINRMAETTDGLQWLSNAFHLCCPLKSKEDVAVFKGWLSETWVSLAMVDYPYPASFLEPLPAWPIQVVCKFLKDPKSGDKDLLQDIFQAVNVYYNYTGDTPCLNTSQTASGSLGDLGWSYQACTEMVMPFCSDGVSDMFEPQSWDLQAFSDECYKQWGVRPRGSWVTTVYGGKNISSHSNIIFSNGGLDPWSAGGVKESLSDSLLAVLIPEGAHHLDLRSNNADDPKSVLLARSLEVEYMKKWIAQARTGRD